jgi:hypothetical protein
VVNELFPRSFHQIIILPRSKDRGNTEQSGLRAPRSCDDPPAAESRLCDAVFVFCDSGECSPIVHNHAAWRVCSEVLTPSAYQLYAHLASATFVEWHPQSFVYPLSLAPNGKSPVNETGQRVGTRNQMRYTLYDERSSTNGLSPWPGWARPGKTDPEP